MPGLLRSIFKPSGSRTHTSRPRTNTGDFSPTELSPGANSLSTVELEGLAEILRSQLAGSGGGSENRRPFRNLLNLSGARSQEPQQGMTRQMLDVLENVRDERQRERVTPFPRSSSSIGHEHDGGRRSGKWSPPPGGFSGPRSRGTDVWDQAYQAFCEAISAAECALRGVESPRERAMLERCAALLQAQRAELIDMRSFADGQRAPTLATLSQIYEKAASDLQNIRNSPNETEGRDRIATILQVLAEGPDYLLDVALIEAIIWQADVIDSSFGANIREILNKAVKDQSDLVKFRRAAERIVAATATLPKKLLDDELSKDAYRAIGTLIRQLQARVAGSRQPSAGSSSSRLAVSSSGGATSREPTGPPSGVVTPFNASPAVSPPTSRSTSPAPSLSGELERLAIPDLQARYGTGPTASFSPTPSTSARPTPTPTPSASAPVSVSVSATPTPQRSAAPSPPSPGSPDSEKSIWEYRGHLLTRSALELVMRQEALAMADSSGQYAGEVSWDDVRNAWIPTWAEKLKSDELAEGEIPSTNPADFKYRKTDAWGNKIGWYNGIMFYEEDPAFDLK